MEGEKRQRQREDQDEGDKRERRRRIVVERSDGGETFHARERAALGNDEGEEEDEEHILHQVPVKYVGVRQENIREVSVRVSTLHQID